MPRPALIERFWAKVNKTETCWVWTASTRPGGYGQFMVWQGQLVAAHRLSWEMVHGPVPVGLCVLHKCDNPPCVRPEHLFLGTAKDNIHDMIKKGRRKIGSQKRGADSQHAKLSAKQVIDLRRLWNEGHLTIPALARRFGVGCATISSVARNLTYIDPSYTPVMRWQPIHNNSTTPGI